MRAFSGPGRHRQRSRWDPRPVRCPCAPPRSRKTACRGWSKLTVARRISARPRVTASLVPAGGNEPAAKTDAVLTDYAARRRRRHPARLVRAAAERYCARAVSRARARGLGQRAGRGPHARSQRTGRRRRRTLPRRTRAAFHPKDVLDGDYVSRAHQALRDANNCIGSRPEGIRSVREERLRRCGRGN